MFEALINSIQNAILQIKLDPWWEATALAGELVLYCLGLGYGSIHVAKQTTLKHSLLAPLVFVILHFGYGIGCFWGFVRFVLLSGTGLPKPEEHSLSR